MIAKINNFNTSKILKNRFKKNKNSSMNATLIYLLFENSLRENIIEIRRQTNNIKNGLAVRCFSRLTNEFPFSDGTDFLFKDSDTFTIAKSLLLDLS